MDAVNQAAGALFYVEDCPCKDSAVILDVPIGTVVQLGEILLSDDSRSTLDRNGNSFADNPDDSAAWPENTLPILGVPMPSKHLQGMESLLSTAQMPAGIPVATFAMGDAGAQNAGLFAVALIAGQDAALKARLVAFRAAQEAKIKATVLPPPG